MYKHGVVLRFRESDSLDKDGSAKLEHDCSDSQNSHPPSILPYTSNAYEWTESNDGGGRRVSIVGHVHGELIDKTCQAPCVTTLLIAVAIGVLERDETLPLLIFCRCTWRRFPSLGNDEATSSCRMGWIIMYNIQRNTAERPAPRRNHPCIKSEHIARLYFYWHISQSQCLYAQIAEPLECGATTRDRYSVVQCVCVLHCMTFVIHI